MPEKIVAVHGLAREDWLTIRRNYIGGSDAPAVVGLNPWSSRYALWADKTGRLPPKEDNEAMRQGRDLEAYVASRWAEAVGKRARRAPYMLGSAQWPFAAVNLDREVIGERAFLECKTTSVLNLKNFKHGEYPTSYYVQCVHGLAVTGCERAYLAVLVLNQGFYCYTVERDEDEISALMQAEREFWALVETDTPPDPDGMSATTAALSGMFGAGRGGELELFGMDGKLAEWFRIVEQEQALKLQKETLKQQFMQALGDAERGVGGIGRVDWKTQTRSTLNTAALQQAHPELDLTPYTKTTRTRAFSVKPLRNDSDPTPTKEEEPT